MSRLLNEILITRSQDAIWEKKKKKTNMYYTFLIYRSTIFFHNSEIQKIKEVQLTEHYKPTILEKIKNIKKKIQH